jgi:hypothetical protein
MALHLTTAATAAYLRLVSTEELGLLPRQLTPEALPSALACCNSAATFRLEHPHLVGTPDHWGPGAALTVQRWDAEDQQLQQELAHYVRTARVQLPGCAP